MSKLNNPRSGTKPKSPTKGSNRQKRKAKRIALGQSLKSRPNRRSERRLNARIGGWKAEHPVSGILQKRPGKVDAW